MGFMLIVKAGEDSETGFMPSEADRDGQVRMRSW